MPEFKEEWRDIEGYEGYYQVSNLGRVRSLRSTRGRLLDAPKIKKATKDNKGYLNVNFSVERKHKTYKVHRLVATAFIPNPDNKPQVNHIDGDKSNNRVDNLEWCTPSENINHALRTGLIVPLCGEELPNALFTDDEVKAIRREYIFRDKNHGTKALSKKYGVSISSIKNIVRNKTYIDNDYVLPEKRKITQEQATRIRKAYISKSSEFNAKELAKKYGVTPEAIYAIARNKVFRDENYIPPPVREPKFSDEEIRKIREEYIPYDKEYSASVLARKYNTSESLIRDIIQRKKYKKVK